MHTDLYELKAFSPEHGLHALTLEVHEVGDDYMVTCELPVVADLVAGQADDCFAALQIVRRKAEGKNWKICCKGSRLNVWPSTMSRQMGGGVKAYVLEMGRQGCLETMVEIFDEDTPEFYSAVADQESFAHAWFESLG